MQREQKRTFRATGWALATIALVVPILHGQDNHGQDNGNTQTERNRKLFTTETFGGNGRTCDTCHRLNKSGTVSPADAQELYRKNPRDPLFLADGSDDGQGHGVNRILQDATILVQIPLPPNVSVMDDPTARSVIFARGIPTTRNTPALDPVLMLDGRDPDLPTQALHAIQRHFQVTATPSLSDLFAISQFELTEPFFSSPTLRRFAQVGSAPVLPEGTTDSEKRGRLFFIDAPVAGDGRRGACGLCHGGPMLNQTTENFRIATNGLVPAGSRFQSVGVSELNEGGNTVRTFIFRRADGTEQVVSTPDPGRALITGRTDPPPPVPSSDFNAFKIPTLWGVKDTAPYFHDNSAKTLEDVVAHYARFFLLIPAHIVLSDQDQRDIVAYMKLLN